MTDRGRIVAMAMSIVLAFAAFALGAAHGGTAAVVQIAIWTLVAVWFAGRPTLGETAARATVPRPVFALGVGLMVYLALQCVPLPRGILAIASPTTADVYRQTVDALPADSGAATAITPVGAADRQAIPVEDRERIRDLAGSSRSADAWRPIALHPFAARSEWLRYLAYGLVLWLAATITAPRALLVGISFTGIAVAALGIVQRATWNGSILWVFDRLEGPSVAEETRVLGPFVNPDHFAAFLAMALFPTWALSRELIRDGQRTDSATRSITGIVLAVGCGVIVAGLVGSASRGAILGALGGAALWIAGAVRSPAGRDRAESIVQHWSLRIAPAALGVAVLVLGFVFAGTIGRETLDRRLASSGGSVEFRLELWAQSLGMVRDFPLFGVGAGGWREAFLRYERYPLTWMRPNHAHNDYLEWISEVGVIGLAISLALAWAVARWAWSNRSISNRFRWPLLGAVAVIAIHSVGDFSLRASANSVLAALLVGLLCNRHWRREMRLRVAYGRWSRSASYAAAAVASVLVLASAMNLRESIVWSRVHDGTTRISAAPQDGSSWEELGIQLYRNGFRYHPPTREAFRAAIDRRPTAERSYWLLALSTPRAKDRQQALEAALVLHPSAALWRVEYAKLLERGGKHDAALAEIERAAYLDPRVEQQSYLKGVRGALAESVVQAAERGFLRALGEHPGDAALSVEVASFYEAVGNAENAARHWREAAIASGDWGTYGLRAAEVYAKAGERERAEVAFRDLIARAPALEAGYRRLALEVLLPAGKLDEAALVLRTGIERTLEPAMLQVALATVETARGKVDDSRSALERAEASGRWHPEVQYLIGKEYLQVGDLEKATKAFARAFELEPRVARYAFLLGQTREQMYDLEGALDAYRRASKLEPRDEVLRKRVERIEQLASATEASKREIAK